MKDNSKKKETDGKGSKFSSARKFLDKLDFSQGLESEIKDPEKSGGLKSEDDSSKHESHALPSIDSILKFFKVKDIESGKNKLKIIIGVMAGLILIILGIIYILAPSDTVADNVIFGEKAVFSVFLFLAGILIIAVVLAQKYLNKSFFGRINKELDSNNEMSSDQDEKDIKKVNINRNNR